MLFYLLKKGDALLSYAERGGKRQLSRKSVSEEAQKKRIAKPNHSLPSPRKARQKKGQKEGVCNAQTTN